MRFNIARLPVYFAPLMIVFWGSLEARELRVCADPNNLPFSNQAQQGLENRLVDIVAGELHAEVRYVWWAQRRGNIRNTLGQGLCDLIPGVAAGLEALATTQPYYHSTYVFVSRAERNLKLDGFDDERLRSLLIGVQMIGDDFSNTPPAHAMSRRGIVDNVRGYMLYGDYATPSPARTVMDDVASGKIDVAIVWGPVAGYFSRKQAVALRLQPVPVRDGGVLPMTFAVSMGVRKGNDALLAELNSVLQRRRTAIQQLIGKFGIPETTSP